MLLTDAYAQLRDSARVRERALIPAQRIPNELELQARWFAGDFGKEFRSTAGDKIDIVQFGVWNREAGPDFCDAAIRINGSEPMRGCIEFDLTDRNWEAHGHATNPAFDETVLHIFVHKSEREFFSRTSSNRNVPQIMVDLAALSDSFSANVPLARPGRCQAPLKNLPEERVRSILKAAAQFRQQRKTASIQRKIDSHSLDEALFQEIAAALGYKQNKLPFTLLAQRLPLKILRAQIDDVEAMLFGAAGFLENPDLAGYEMKTRDYVRALWDRWWPYRDKMNRIVLPAKIWRMSGARPLNYPQRRLGALSILVREWTRFRRLIDVVATSRLLSPRPSPTGRGGSFSSREKVRMRDLHDFFATLDHPFWNFHYTLDSDPSTKAMAIVGETRVAEILANVLFPFFASEGRDVWNDYEKLPSQLSNRRVETAATRLFGDDPRRPLFLKTVAHQQALLQIYEDFCLQDNSDCAQCPFPEQMQKWK